MQVSSRSSQALSSDLYNTYDIDLPKGILPHHATISPLSPLRSFSLPSPIHPFVLIIPFIQIPPPSYSTSRSISSQTNTTERIGRKTQRNDCSYPRHPTIYKIQRAPICRMIPKYPRPFHLTNSDSNTDKQEKKSSAEGPDAITDFLISSKFSE